ncbi:MAG: sugar ABC transporter substrate-binding protein [Candidatus Rifleibacteriota bacterium]
MKCRNKKLFFSLFCLMTFLLLFATACEKSEKSKKDEKQLLIWFSGSSKEIDFFQRTIDSFSQSFPGVRLELQPFNFNNLKPSILGAAESQSNRPDIIMFASDWLGELAEKKILKELSETPANFLPVAAKAMKYKDKTYGIPYSLETIALIYNSKMLATPPADIKALTELKLPNENNIYPLLYDNKNFYFHAPWFHSFGARIFNNGDLSIASAEAADSIDFALALEQKYKLLAKKSNQPAAINLFCAGKAAMTINGPWIIPDLELNKVSYKVCPIPGQTPEKPAKPFVGIKGLGITRFCNEKVNAENFLKFLTSEKNILKAVNNSIFIPCISTVKKQNFDSEWIKGFIQQAEHGIPMPTNPEMKYVWSEMNRVLRLKFIRHSNSIELLKEAQKRIIDSCTMEEKE